MRSAGFGSGESTSVNSSRCADDILDSLLNEYDRFPQPISISFRSILPSLGFGERATHLFHPYPAKLIRHIPYLFLNSKLCAPTGTVLLDPFCGSGTVLVEGTIAGLQVQGADSNPLARMIAKSKLEPVSTDRLNAAIDTIMCNHHQESGQLPRSSIKLPFWYSERILLVLAKIQSSIRKIEDDAIRNFLQVCFSACARKLSNADPRVSVPVKINPLRYPESHPLRKRAEERIQWITTADVAETFATICRTNVARLRSLVQLAPWTQMPEIIDDARLVSNSRLRKSSLVITSPPYASAQKYLRSSGLSLAWMGLLDDLSLRQLECNSIGKEHASKSELRASLPPTGIDEADRLILDIASRNSLRAYLISNYINEMRSALSAIEANLVEGGFFVLVAGNNRVAGVDFPTHKYLNMILASLGLVTRLELIDTIHTRGLMTKRNQTASRIETESVTLFEKPYLGE